jgi:hypothetical protein
MVIDQVGEKKVAGVKEFRDAVADIQGPVLVHVIGIGVKVIQPPGAEKDDTKPSPEKPKGKRGKKSAEKPAEEKPAAKPEDGGKDKPAGEGKP